MRLGGGLAAAAAQQTRNCCWTWPAPAWAAGGEPLTSASADPSTPGSYPRYPAPEHCNLLDPPPPMDLSRAQQQPAVSSHHSAASRSCRESTLSTSTSCQLLLEPSLHLALYWCRIDVESVFRPLLFAEQQAMPDRNLGECDKTDGNASTAVAQRE